MRGVIRRGLGSGVVVLFKRLEEDGLRFACPGMAITSYLDIEPSMSKADRYSRPQHPSFISRIQFLTLCTQDQCFSLNSYLA